MRSYTKMGGSCRWPCAGTGEALSKILYIWPPVTSQTQREAFCADDGYDAGVETSTDHSDTFHSGDVRDRAEHPGMSHFQRNGISSRIRPLDHPASGYKH